MWNPEICQDTQNQGQGDGAFEGADFVNMRAWQNLGGGVLWGG